VLCQVGYVPLWSLGLDSLGRPVRRPHLADVQGSRENTRVRDVVGLLKPETVQAAPMTELSTARRLLPDQSHQLGLLARVEEVSEWLMGSLTTDWQPSPERVVSASKGRHGVRPVALWDLRTAVVYRTLTDRLATGLTRPVRSGAAWTEFQREPLERPGQYIVTADIAACYQVLDHGELAREVNIQAGDGATVDAVIWLLQSTSGRRYGLPQQSSPSCRCLVNPDPLVPIES
jgi:hypothetical protein